MMSVERDLLLVLAGGIVGLITSLVIFGLQILREDRHYRSIKRHEDYRAALRYGTSERKDSLAGADLSNRDLAFANMSGIDLRHSKLRNCRMYRVNLERAMLAACDLRGAQLVRANLKSADLWGVNLESADLSYADLSNAGLLRANLRNAKLIGANLEGAVLEGPHGIGGFSRANMEGVDLTDTVLPHPDSQTKT